MLIPLTHIVGKIHYVTDKNVGLTDSVIEEVHLEPAVCDTPGTQASKY